MSSHAIVAVLMLFGQDLAAPQPAQSAAQVDGTMAYIPFEALQLVRTPTIADRHTAISRLTIEDMAAWPDEGVEVSVDCIAQPRLGTLVCPTALGEPPERFRLLTAARELSRAYAFRVGDLDPEGGVLLKTRLTVQFRKSDLVEYVPPAEGAVLAMSEVQWARAPSREWLAQQSEEWPAGVHTIRALCQIQTDRSVICASRTTEFNGEPYPGGRSWSNYLGGQIIGSLQAAPELADGSTAIGRWFLFQLTLRVTE